MVGSTSIARIRGRRHAEEDLLPLDAGLPQQPRDNGAHDRQAVRLLRVQNTIVHRPARFHMEDLGEFLGIVAGYQNFRPVNLVNDRRVLA